MLNFIIFDVKLYNITTKYKQIEDRIEDVLGRKFEELMNKHFKGGNKKEGE